MGAGPAGTGRIPRGLQAEGEDLPDPGGREQGVYLSDRGAERDVYAQEKYMGISGDRCAHGGGVPVRGTHESYYRRVYRKLLPAGVFPGCGQTPSGE